VESTAPSAEDGAPSLLAQFVQDNAQRPHPNSTIVTRRGPMMGFLPRSVAPVLWSFVDVNGSRLFSSRLLAAQTGTISMP